MYFQMNLIQRKSLKYFKTSESSLGLKMSSNRYFVLKRLSNISHINSVLFFHLSVQFLSQPYYLNSLISPKCYVFSAMPATVIPVICKRWDCWADFFFRNRQYSLNFVKERTKFTWNRPILILSNLNRSKFKLSFIYVLFYVTVKVWRHVPGILYVKQLFSSNIRAKERQSKEFLLFFFNI